ncbi:MAG: hypothetical protein IJE68_00985 [Clostridia bacterium]|nr:hypothetical protein [Clostridia bacterium]
MKKFRSLILICVLVYTMLSLAGCQAAVPIPEGANERATLVMGEQQVKVYSPVLSTIDLEVTVQYSGKETTLVKQIRVGSQGTEIITVENLGEDLFDENAKIINATIIKQMDQRKANKNRNCCNFDCRHTSGMDSTRLY